MAEDGKDTTEFQVAQTAGAWGVVAMILGFIITVGSEIASAFDVQSRTGIILGAAIAIAGIVLRTLTALGYIKARADVKMARLLGQQEPKS